MVIGRWGLDMQRNKTKCPNCLKRKAIIDEVLGVTFCKVCRQERDKPHYEREWTSENIKESRREFKKDIIAPFRGGVFSDEYYQEYGTSGVKVTEEQIKNKRKVWKDLKGSWQLDKSKGGRNKE